MHSNYYPLGTHLDRFVGIVVGVVAMRLAFAFPRPESSALDADDLGVDADHRKAP